MEGEMTKRDYWTPAKLKDAARLLNDAADHLNTAYPYSQTRPNPDTLPAVKAMIDAAIECVKAARPTHHPEGRR